MLGNLDIKICGFTYGTADQMYVTRRNARLDCTRDGMKIRKIQDLLVMYRSKTQGIKLWEESLLLGLRV